ncbi:hypothetical protein LTR17_006292 [Elasticomyces elasticus]|nr:hypothetical protein LTR17_006292 [Elasticomyces elasticus]
MSGIPYAAMHDFAAALAAVLCGQRQILPSLSSTDQRGPPNTPVPETAQSAYSCKRGRTVSEVESQGRPSYKRITDPNACFGATSPELQAQYAYRQSALHMPSAQLDPGQSWSSLVDCLDVDVVKYLLALAASESVDIALRTRQAYDDFCGAQAEAIEEEMRTILDLSHYSRKAWHILHKKYVSDKGSVEYNNAGPAFNEVDAIVEEIHEQAHESSSYGTRKSAMETLRKIGKSIVLTPSTLGSEVRQNMNWNFTLPDTMQAILESMSVKQRLRLADSADEKGMFFDKMEELMKMAEDHCMWEERLDPIVTLLGGTDGTDDEEEEDAGDEGDDETETEATDEDGEDEE